MSVDMSNLTKIPMRKRKDYKTGFRYYNKDEVLVAKTCSICFKVKDVNCFSNDKNSFDGLWCSCRDCRSALRKKTYKPNPNRKKQPPRTSERNKIYRDTQNERLTRRTKEELLEDRNRLNPDGIKRCRVCRNHLALSGFHNSMHRADGLADTCKSCQVIKNNERIRKTNIRYWESKGIPIKCYVCEGPYEDSEHIIPLALEGPDMLSNMLPSCTKCNRGIGGKHAKPLKEWLFSKFSEDEAKTILDRVTGYGIDIGQ